MTQLDRYLTARGETSSAFAARAGVSRGLVCYARQGRAVEDAAVARKIVEATGGEVTLDSLCEPRPSPLGEWMREHEMSPADLAKVSGVTRQTIYNVARGMRLTRLSYARALSAATGGAVPLDALLVVPEAGETAEAA